MNLIAYATSMTDLDLLIRDKYNGDAEMVTVEDKERLAAGEPLAYVIGWIPFLGLHIALTSKPLIPRPETEWWTELLLERLRERTENLATPFHVLDLCAGSGAIGLSVLQRFPTSHVTFSELSPEHCAQIRENIILNNLDAQRALVVESDLYDQISLNISSTNCEPLRFDVIACNPPYIPSGRVLDASVAKYEPSKALFSGADGLDLIRRIAQQTPTHLNPGGELWLEADVSNIEQARELLLSGGAVRAEILTDLYDRPRVVVAYYL